MINRRGFAMGASAALVGYGLSGGPNGARAARGLSSQFAGDLDKIEVESAGRLGVAVLDTLSGERTGHRLDERFPMCSTFKLLAAAAILARVDAQRERLDRRITFAASEVVVNSPVTKDRHGGTGMSLAELCEAAMTVSDNTAGNLLLASLGGPAGLTAFARSLGDAVTRLDRIEPELNEAIPGDPRDTTTPGAMLANLHTLALGHALSAKSREQLVSGWSATRPGTRACGPASPPGGAWGTRPGPGRMARPTTSA